MQPAPARPAPTTRPAPARTNLNPILAIATVVLLITTILFGLMALAPSSAPIKTKSVQRAAAVKTENSIETVARQFVANLMTYNYRTIDSDLDRALRFATREFPSRSLTALGGRNIDAVKREARSHHSTSAADVKGVAITAHDKDTATAIVVFIRTLQGDKTDNGVKVIELTLLNTSDGWKVDNATKPVSG